MKKENLEVYDAVVLGAGVSGLVAASLLLESGCASVLVLEEFDRIGGNHIGVNIGEYTFDVGSFFFQDDSPFLRHFPEILPLYLPGEYTIGRLTPQGRVVRYPASLKDDVLKAGPVEWLRLAASVGMARTFGKRDANALSFAEYWLGRHFVRRSGLASYMYRFYGVEPSRMEASFASKRMGWIAEHASIGGALRNGLSRQRAVKANRELVRPREGFHVLYEAVAASLTSRGAIFRLDEPLVGLEQRGKGMIAIKTAFREVETRRLVSTVPVRRALALAGLDDEEALSAVDLLTLFYSHAGPRGFDQHVLYNFDTEGAWKRLTMHSDFYGEVEGRSYFSVEVNAAHVGASAVRADRDFRDHTSKHSLFEGDLVLEGSRLTQSAYPVYLSGATDAAQGALKKLRDFGTLSFGRQGGFDYQPTARVSTQVAEREILGREL
ncbi:FAD-dependent oxidoreductase [Caulobacter sp. FWC2]|uniref:FAD-dependent oxidoreductase n=1 Tax=Caulobacter sp. FWC2 TaxID=69664 RepID=UPI0018ECB8B5|nr:FAD-dependent oxidoreductase [Caulobacter sp. FWC2]